MEVEMPNTRRNNRRNDNNSRKQRGSGVLTDIQWFNPEILPPHSPGPYPSSYSTPDQIRPVILSTYQHPQAGGRKDTRRNRKDRRNNRKNSSRKNSSRKNNNN